MDFFKEKLDQVVGRISRFEIKKGNQIDDNDERGIKFEPIPLHGWGDNLQGLPQDLVLHNITIISDIMIFHMGLQRQMVPDLKLFQKCHFNHHIRGLARFRDNIFPEVHNESSTNKGHMEG